MVVEEKRLPQVHAIRFHAASPPRRATFNGTSQASSTVVSESMGQPSRCVCSMPMKQHQTWGLCHQTSQSTLIQRIIHTPPINGFFRSNHASQLGPPNLRSPQGTNSEVSNCHADLAILRRRLRLGLRWVRSSNCGICVNHLDPWSTSAATVC